MGTPPLTREEAQAAVDLVKLHGSLRAASRASGMHRTTIQSRLRRAAEYGLYGTPQPVPEGFEVQAHSYQYDGDGQITGQSVRTRRAVGAQFETPEGHRVKGVSVLRDAEGRVIQQWTKTTAEQQSLEHTIEAIRAAFEAHRGAAPAVAALATPVAETLTVYPLADWHVGLLSWKPESGEDYDLKIAERTILDAIRKLIDLSPPSKECVVLGLGDLMHFDGYEPVTARSGNALDTDSRYPKVLRTAARMVMATIEMALTKHETVRLRILAGNHDDISALAISLALALFYESHDRVTVDDSPSRFWWHRFGKVLLGATHGDKTKMRDLPLVMAHDRPEDWAASTYRRIYTGHIHHESAVEEGGVLVTSMRSPAARDAYHAFAKYRSGRSVYSDTYDRDGGVAASVKVNLA